MMKQGADDAPGVTRPNPLRRTPGRQVAMAIHQFLVSELWHAKHAW